VLLIIGFDGATWDVAEPLIAAGRMPHLARLRQRGLFGPLASTMPPATFPSWTTFATGVNPGRHGIFDFTRRIFGTYDVTFINSTFRAIPSIWRRLSDARRRVCVLGLPGTYPPEHLNGCMISGFDTPVTTRADASFVDPPELAPLVMEMGGFPFADFQEFRVGPRWYPMALDRLRRSIDVKTRLAERLLRQQAWDCFMLLFGESDTVAHHFWKFHDPTSPRFEEADEVVSGAIGEIYDRLDAALGTLMSRAEADHVLVVSDHGFGGAGRKCVYINRLLAQSGFQHRHDRGSRLSSAFKRLALKAVPPGLQAHAMRFKEGQWASRLESRARFGGIEWERTTAFSEELNYFPSVWLNLKGREPEGVVATADYERARDDVIAMLEAWRDPSSGRPVVRRAWRREEAFHGPWVSHAPDILLDLQLDEGCSYNCLSSTSWTGGAFRVLGDGDLRHSGKLSSMSGSHRVDGLFVLAGEGVPQGCRVADASIADMAPTIMSLGGCEAPGDLDGRRLVGVPIPSDAFVGAESPAPTPYTAAEEREIAERLSALGYID
jgi:predicted AlkP superfamily phosphohydrolase/phosphomutase